MYEAINTEVDQGRGPQDCAQWLRGMFHNIEIIWRDTTVLCANPFDPLCEWLLTYALLTKLDP